MGKVKLIQVFGIHWSEVFYGFGGLYGIFAAFLIASDRASAGRLFG